MPARLTGAPRVTIVSASPAVPIAAIVPRAFASFPRNRSAARHAIASPVSAASITSASRGSRRCSVVKVMNARRASSASIEMVVTITAATRIRNAAVHATANQARRVTTAAAS
jgi:hypothetical protein